MLSLTDTLNDALYGSIALWNAVTNRLSVGDANDYRDTVGIFTNNYTDNQLDVVKYSDTESHPNSNIDASVSKRNRHTFDYRLRLGIDWCACNN